MQGDRLFTISSSVSPPSEIVHYKRSRIHQSSIKSMTTTRIDATTLLLVSGGDDNALGFTLLRCAPASSASLSETDMTFSTLLIPSAHASAVTALVTVPCPEAVYLHAAIDKPVTDAVRGIVATTEVKVVSSSNDQRIKQWRVAYTGGLAGVDGLQITKEADEVSSVADIAGLAGFHPPSPVSPPRSPSDVPGGELATNARQAVEQQDGEATRGNVTSRARSGFRGGKNSQVVLCGVGIDVWALT